MEAHEEKPFLKVIVHSFFIIPFLIAVFCLLLFTAINLLTREQRSAYDYLEDVKTGGLSKRWQGAFELSRILANSKLTPKEERFTNEMITAFKESKHDDNRVRQYLALAMGRTGRPEFIQPIVAELKEEKEENLSSLLYALGMLKAQKAAANVSSYLDHADPRIRSIAAVSLGSIADPSSIPLLKKSLHDPEPNVQWGSAISLAQMGDLSGKDVLLQLLNRSYLGQFSEVDPDEQTNLMLMTLQATAQFDDKALRGKILELSQSDPNMKIRSAAYAVLANAKLN